MDLIAPGPIRERRTVVRLPCQVAVEVVTPDGIQFSTVTDLSTQGMRLEGPTNLGKGQTFEVLQPKSKLGAVTCQVVWCKPVPNTRNITMGLTFADTPQKLAKSWVKEQLLALGFDASKRNERRNFIRFPAPSLQVFLVDGVGDVLAEGRLINIGHGGALVGLVTQVSCETGVRVVIEATHETPALDTLAVVKSFHKSAKKFYVTGLQFAKPGDSDIKRLVRAVRKKTGS